MMRYLAETVKHILQGELTSVRNIPVRGYYIGDRGRVFRSPYIIIDPESKSIDWMTIRYTEDEMTLSIYGYIQAASREDDDLVESLTLLSTDFGEELRKTMMNHIQFYLFSSSEIDGREFYSPQFLVDNYGLTVGEYYNQYPGTDQEPSVVFLFDGRVTNVDYQFVKKDGTFLRAVKIDCFWKHATPITTIGPSNVNPNY
jgi:hypothetical protein